MKVSFELLIQIHKTSDVPLYRQIANGISMGIERGMILPGSKLPGTRELSSTLKLHRNTIIAAYEDLSDQGWVHISPPVGTFVNTNIPKIMAKNLTTAFHYPEKTGYTVELSSVLHIPKASIQNFQYLEIDEGLPDVRIAPLIEIDRAYRNVAKRIYSKQNLSYTDVRGNLDLRMALSKYLRESRGLRAKDNNILITRGSQMALYLTISTLISKNDNVAIGDTNYFLATNTLLHAGANLVIIPVDEHGMDIDHLESVCKKKKIRAIFVTPHHHYPTTVTLSSERRVKLLSLAEQYGICIIEDDYDFDFHYSSSPILPLASADTKGMVVYIGSLFKSIAPAIRVGYMVAPSSLINEVTKLRRIIDLQGDSILEQAVADLMQDGEIRRHLKKAVVEYQKRRDHFCHLLEKKLGSEVEFKVPDGGMAIWAKFDNKIDLQKISDEAFKRKLIISDGSQYKTKGENINALRMGFASLTPQEMEKALALLTDIIHKQE